MAKSCKKRVVGRKQTSRRRPPSTGGLLLLGPLAVLLVIVMGGYLLFDDRHWHAFDDAGDGAFSRQNYKYAQSMYREALREAKRLEDRQLVAATLADLQRVTLAQGLTGQAADYAARRAAIEREHAGPMP